MEAMATRCAARGEIRERVEADGAQGFLILVEELVVWPRRPCLRNAVARGCCRTRIRDGDERPFEQYDFLLLILTVTVVIPILLRFLLLFEIPILILVLILTLTLTITPVPGLILILTLTITPVPGRAGGIGIGIGDASGIGIGLIIDDGEGPSRRNFSKMSLKVGSRTRAT